MVIPRLRSAFSLVELLIVVAIVAVLAFLVLPGIANRRARSSRLNCVNNLKQIGLSFKTFSIDNDDHYPFELEATKATANLVSSGLVWPHFSIMSNELSTPKVLVCPEDKERRPGTNFSLIDLQISYFLGVDATEGQSQVVLSGDRFLGVNGKRLKPGLHAVPANSNIGWVKSWHEGDAGNILLSDGSVQLVPNNRLKAIFAAGGLATNRIAVP